MADDSKLEEATSVKSEQAQPDDTGAPSEVQQTPEKAMSFDHKEHTVD